MIVLPAADRIATRWKNGLGVTREVAAWPPGAGLDDFDWRISIATVEVGGPFSSFPEVDRILTILDGRMALSVDGGMPVPLDPDSAPFAFPGDAPVIAEILSGPITDLNVMVRRGRTEASVQRLEAGDAIVVTLAACTAIIPLTAPLYLDMAGRSFALSALDAALFDREMAESVTLSSRGSSAVIHLTKRRS